MPRRFAAKVLTTPRDEDLAADRGQILPEKMAQMEGRSRHSAARFSD
jgi:hypothetical protein